MAFEHCAAEGERTFQTRIGLARREYEERWEMGRADRLAPDSWPRVPNLYLGQTFLAVQASVEYVVFCNLLSRRKLSEFESSGTPKFLPLP